MEIVVGREAQKAEPRLALTCEGQTIYMGTPGCVSKHMSRRHCRIEVNADNTVSVYDITDDNFIYVNGKECKSKKNIPLSSKVELGSDRYPLDLQMIVSAFTARQSYSIAHLERIYEDYSQFKFNYQVKQTRMGVLSGLPMAISMLSGVLALFFESIKTPMVILAAIMLVSFIFIRLKKAETGPQELRQREDRFHDEYVCPNPSCQHFLGTMQYKDLVKLNNCPYCKAKWRNR